MADKKTFDFADVNPGLSGMAFAAEAEGGVCIGVSGVRPGAVAAYEDFFGRNAVRRPTEPSDVILASLPFTMFAGGETTDPAVRDIVREAAAIAKHSKKTSIVLFRVSWSPAERLGVDQLEYLQAVGKCFEDEKWALHSLVSDDHNDLFVCAVSRRHWTGDVPLPASIPRAVKGGKLSNPQEILTSYGYPQAFALRNADIAPNLLDGIVTVGNARAAISAALASVR